MTIYNLAEIRDSFPKFEETEDSEEKLIIKFWTKW